MWTDGFLHLALYRKKCRILYFMLTEGSRFSHYLCITITMIQFAINWGISPFNSERGKSHWEALNQAAPMREHRKNLRLFFPSQKLKGSKWRTQCAMEKTEAFTFLCWAFSENGTLQSVLWDSLMEVHATFFHSYCVGLNNLKWLRHWVKGDKMDAVC